MNSPAHPADQSNVAPLILTEAHPITLAGPKPLAECADPHEAIANLCAGFADFDMGGLNMQEVGPEEIPCPARPLLVHPRHMTRTLVEHYGVPVDLHILQRHADDRVYSRKVLITLQETARVVEYGIARVNLDRLIKPVEKAILAEHAPLGSILINHNVLRRIQPRWFVRLALGSSMLAWFDCQKAGPLYGRITTIYCNKEPTIELLEIVTALPRP
jgi:hypothetical protein